MKRILDLLFVTRPVVLLPVVGFALFGFRNAHGELSFGSWDSISPLMWSKILLFTLSVAAVYVANQISDFEVDSDNEGFPLLVKSGMSKKCAIGLTAFLAAVSIVVPLILQWYTIALLSGISLLIGWAYCFKPLYFTGRPIFDFLSNALGYGLVAYLAGWSLLKGIDASAFLAALPYIGMMASGSISSTLPDIEGDALHGKNTTAVVFGIKKAHILSTLLLLGTLLISIRVWDIVAIVASAAALPIYLLYLVYPKDALKEATYKIGGGVSMLCIAVYVPHFFVIGLITAFGTKLYFRKIYNVSYPSLLPVEES